MPGKKISKKEVVRLVKKFKKSGEKDNTKSVWYSLADIQEVVRLIGNLTDPLTGKVGDGVRVYYGRYPQNVADPSKRDRNTVLFVPTYNKDGGSEHHDYISEEEVKKLSKEIGDPDSGTELDLESVALLDGEGEEGYNHGSMCPTECTGANVGDA